MSFEVCTKRESRVGTGVACLLDVFQGFRFAVDECKGVWLADERRGVQLERIPLIKRCLQSESHTKSGLGHT